MLVANYTTKKILVDNGNSIDILFGQRSPKWGLTKIGYGHLPPIDGVLRWGSVATGVYNTPHHCQNRKAHDDHYSKLPCSQGPLLIQCHHRATKAEQLETSHLDQPPEDEVSNGEWCRSGVRQASGGKGMLCAKATRQGTQRAQVHIRWPPM